MIARKNIMENAAHGSSGLNELKTCGAGLLTSAKKIKIQLQRAAGRITKYVIFFAFVFFCFLVFSDDYQALSFTRYYFNLNGQEPTSSVFSLSCSLSDADSLVLPYLFRNRIIFRYAVSGSNIGNLAQPTYNFNNVPQISINNPIECVDTNSNVRYFGYGYLPKCYSLILFCSAYYFTNPNSKVFVTNSSHQVSFLPRDVFSEVLMSTNSLVVSSFFNQFENLASSLGAVHSSVLDNGETQSDIFDILSGYVGPLRSRPFFEQIEAFSKNNGVYDAYILPSQLQEYKDHYNWLADSDPLAAAHYADSILGSLNSAQSLLNLQRATSDVWPRTIGALNEIGQHLTDYLTDSVNDGFSMTAHIQGATTNMLQRMTNDTAQIKQDLQAWRTDSTNRLERQWDGIKKIRDNTDDIKEDSRATASGVSKIVNDGVKISGPVQVTLGTDNLHVDIANTDLESLVDGFANGSDAAMQRWLDEWELFKEDQLPYMEQFSSFIRANTNLLFSIEKRLGFGFTNTLDATYSFLTNGLESAISNGVAGIGLNFTNELWEYYFDRFKKANEFIDDDGQLFTSIDNQRTLVFGNGFDEAEYKKLDWFSRVELLLYQIGYASTNSTESIEASDLEGKFDDVSDEIQTAATSFEEASRRVVGVFGLVGRFAQAVKNAFSDIAAPSTDGILLLEGGSWIFDEPLYLRFPVLIQNALRLLFQCFWYLSAFIIGWRLVSSAWGRVVSLLRWLWSLIDV